jgi:hypothetical protein
VACQIHATKFGIVVPFFCTSISKISKKQWQLKTKSLTFLVRNYQNNLKKMDNNKPVNFLKTHEPFLYTGQIH